MATIKSKPIITLLMLSLCLLPALRSQPTGMRAVSNPAVKAVAWSYFTTDNRTLAIGNIIAGYASGQFKSCGETILNAGIPAQYYWVHFSLNNPGTTSNMLVVDIDNARLNDLELFEKYDDTATSLGKLGDFYPFSQRSFLHKKFIYRIFLQPRQKKDYFLFVNQVGHTLTLPVKVYPAKEFSSSTFTDYLFDGVTYGILLFVGLLSLLFFLTSRFYLYLFYSLYIMTAILWFLSYFGLGYQYLWGNHPVMNTVMSPLMASLNVLLNLQICQILLQLNRSSKVLNRFANTAKAALIVSAAIPLLFNLNSRGYAVNHAYLLLFLCTILLAMVVVSVSVILYAIRGFIAARVYLIASLLKAGSIVNLALLELGITPAMLNMEGLLQIGIFIEVTLLTYALANRYSIFKLKTFEKVMEAHEKERAMISKEIHDGISNSLTGINYGIADITKDIHYLPAQELKLKKIFHELNRLQVEARNISHNTMPEYIKKSSLADIVEQYVEEVRDKIGNDAKNSNFITIDFSANTQVINFSEAVKLNIFRITQEIISNILRHSKASHADLLFSFGKRELTIIAEDNGIGCKPALQGKKGGMGLNNIRSRVELLEGSISILSPAYKRNPEAIDPPGENHPLATEYGTLIKIKIPYRDNVFSNKNGYDY